MNYIVSTQAENKDLIPDTIKQENLLSAKAIFSNKMKRMVGYFEYLHNGVIYSIKKNKIIAGHFSKKLLVSILSERSVKDCMIVASNGDHFIGLCWIGGTTWAVYDPNFDHANPVIERMGTKEECIKQVFDIIGHAIRLEFASFDSQTCFRFTAWNKAIKTDFYSLLSGHGLLAACESLSSQLLKWLDEAAQSAETSHRIINHCKEVFTEDWYPGTNGLYSIVLRNEKILSHLLKMGKQSPHYETMRKNMIKAIQQKDDENDAVLVALIQHAPDNVLAMMDFLVIDHQSLFFMLNLLNERGNKNRTVWSHLEEYAIEQKSKLFDFFMQKMSGLDYHFYTRIPCAERKLPFAELLLKALMLKIKPQHLNCALQAVIQYLPSALSVIAKLLLLEPTGFDALINALNTRSHFSEDTIWTRLSTQPAEKYKIMVILSEYISQMNEKTLKKKRINFQPSDILFHQIGCWIAGRRV